ncbi:hypothetical protein CPSG_09811 [Coccidioides posadasii str. Silveira]|uniref:Uncharacterized protein n=1 Tax=Coccidioides posadasii (strain RMSCC 757 / Silveira) TaxID=443226 RepID=E9DJ12_COCPS|nr:hypothetical protein CPSG_09811 [Coccidioides posadasii str. Silveira]
MILFHNPKNQDTCIFICSHHRLVDGRYALARMKLVFVPVRPSLWSSRFLYNTESLEILEISPFLISFRPLLYSWCVCTLPSVASLGWQHWYRCLSQVEGKLFPRLWIMVLWANTGQCLNDVKLE